MTRYLARRLGGVLLLLLVMSFLIHGLIGLMPGDPIDLMVSADPNLSTADAARLKALQGLDVPLHERYGRWLAGALRGDLGYSRLYARPAIEVIGPRLLNTLLLMGTSLVLALVIAVPAGILAALHPRGPVDTTINLLAFAGFSMPSFWLGLLLIILFSVELGWLPAGGSAPIGASGLFERLRYLILPVATLTLLTTGTFIRFVRAAMIEALREDFIRTARMKGLSTTAIVVRHALPHTALAMITITALHLGSLFSGALVVETIFAYLGMGKLIYDAILGNDYNLALVALLLATLVTLLANLLADLAYGYFDPRIDHGG